VAPVTFSGVGKVYPDGTRALGSFDVEIDDGEFMVLVGPSGCGKTTALRLVAGLEEVTEGEIRIGEEVVNDLESRDRDVAMVFQNYALYPHMSVFDNIAFGLQTRRVPKAEIRTRVEAIAGTLGLRDLLKRKPRQLSGGQRQRVAMGRAIVRQPRVFLMDEPLSNLDAKLRVQMRAEIARIQRSLAATTIYVTHDQVEAMTMGDRVTVLRKGQLQQIGSPQDVYEHPANLFVASFIGSPSMNLLRARVERSGEGLACRVGDQAIELAPEVAATRPELPSYAGRELALGIRPEHLQDAAFATGDLGARLRGTVTLTEALGSELLVHLEVEAEPVLTEDVLEVASDVDAAAVEELESEARAGRATVVGRFDSRSRVRADEVAEAVVDASRLYFFDLETGTALERRPGR
jgi:multiple sugar transport system ATP-binding protein